jgi:hypothetical protein
VRNIGKHIAEQTEKAIARPMLEVRHPVGGGALKAATENHVSLASHNRTNHQGIFSPEQQLQQQVGERHI